MARLDNFDGPAVGEIAVGYEMFDEAFAIYSKFGLKAQAVKVLLEHGGEAGLAKAADYAATADDAGVWGEVAAAQLAAGDADAAIGAYMKAGDFSRLPDVVTAATAAKAHKPLIAFLQAARKVRKDPAVDSELAAALAAGGDVAALEAFLASPHAANLQTVGDRLFAAEAYDAARAVFARVPNHARVASCMLKLKKHQAALDAARKANSPRTWKEVAYACLDDGETRLAALAALNVIVNADDLDDVVSKYTDRGMIDELASLLESGIGLERAHMGIFTELGILYARHAPAKLMEHIKLFAPRLNVPRLIRVCDDAGLWAELVFLYIAYDEYDNAAGVMMAHSPVAWEHVKFKDVTVKVSGRERRERAFVFFYGSSQKPHSHPHHPHTPPPLSGLQPGSLLQSHHLLPGATP